MEAKMHQYLAKQFSSQCILVGGYKQIHDHMKKPYLYEFSQ